MKMTKILPTLVAVLSLQSLTGCSSKVSVATLEEQKDIARENSMFNAQLFRTNDPRLINFKIIPNGDSSQLPNCPQGDGWATLVFVNMSTNQQFKVKCSTYSKATNCMYEEDFKTKVYANDDGHCQSVDKVPYPLPKIAQ